MADDLDPANEIYPEMLDWPWYREKHRLCMKWKPSTQEYDSGGRLMSERCPTPVRLFLEMVHESLSYPEICEVYNVNAPTKLIPNGDRDHVCGHYIEYVKLKYGQRSIPLDFSFNKVLSGICRGDFAEGIKDPKVRDLIEKSDCIDCSDWEWSSYEFGNE